jgi:uncharacterized protein YkwD
MSGRHWRALALLAFAVAALAAPAAPSARPATTVTAANALEGGLLVEVNALRRRHGLAPLRTNARLRAAAETHSEAMAVHGFFSHDSRDGSSFWKRVERFYASRSYRYWAVGENLLWSSPDVDPQEALEMWLKSPAHRKVLLTPRWREIGLAAVHVPSAPGTFDGREVTILTADFGVRR